MAYTSIAPGDKGQVFLFSYAKDSAMIQVPSATDHFPVVVQLMREGQDLTFYRKCLKSYEASLKAALLSFEMATAELSKLATDTDFDVDDNA